MNRVTIQSILISAIFLLVPSLLTVLSSELARQYLPFVALSLGASAIAIGIQQIYLSGTLLNQMDSERVYFWGAMSLFGFGAFSVVQMLQVFQVIESVSTPAIKRFELFLFFASLVALYRAVAAYLYSEDNIYVGGFVGFRKGAAQGWASIVVILVNALAIVYVAFAPAADLFITESADNGEQAEYFMYLSTLSVYNYFPISAEAFKWLSVVYLLNYLALLFVFVMFIWRNLKKTELPASLPFFIAAMKLFLLLPLVQMAYFVLGYHSSGDLPYFIIGMVILALLVIFTIYQKLGQLSAFKNLCWAMILSTGVIPAFFAWQTDMFGGFPVFYIGLAALTLGFAYLPASALQQITAEQDMDP